LFPDSFRRRRLILRYSFSRSTLDNHYADNPAAFTVLPMYRVNRYQNLFTSIIGAVFMRNDTGNLAN
jgi:hypothetical protein